MYSKTPEPLSFSNSEEITGTRLTRFMQRRSLRIGLLVAGISLVVLTVAMTLWLQSVGVFSVDDKQLEKILAYKPADNTVVYDRNGEKIGEYFSHYYVYVPYDKLPKRLIDAIVAIEDRQYFSHSGIDLRGILRAFLARVFGGSNQGGSTITQQVVRHFLLSQERTFERKAKEAALALRLDALVSKERVLELYTNAMFLGNGAYGVGAAALRYFGRPLDQLEEHELALIAGLFQSPSRYNPVKYADRAKKRQAQVLQAMQRAKYITRREEMEWKKRPLRYQLYNPTNLQLAPHFVDYVQEITQQVLANVDVKNSGLRIYTTLDARVQRQLLEAMQESQDVLNKAERLVYKDNDPKSPEQVETATLVTNPKTGEILAMVGGRDYKKSQFNRTTSAKRQPGSLFKPVVYSLALQRGWKWSDQLYVSPVAIENYRPKNYGDHFLSEITLLRSFFQSVNTTTVEVGQKLGVLSVMEQAKKLGVRTPLKKEVGTLLGSSDVTMFDLASMYGVFANGGKRISPFAITRIENREGEKLYEVKKLEAREASVVSPQVAYLMIQGMKAVFKYGTAAQYPEMAQFAAGKTGTTNDSRDNWFAGCAPQLCAVTWVGADQPESFHTGATGTSLALPLWAKFMKKWASPRPPADFVAPEGVVEVKINSRYGNRDLKEGIPAYFLQGQEPVRDMSTLKSVSNVGSYRSIFD